MTKKKHLQPLTPAALYARVSSDRQDVDLSMSAQLRALRDYAKANGYSVAREYVDEAESGRVADRPEFRKMIEEGSQPNSPFREILVWKFSRFTRKREHAVAFKSMLRRKGVRVVSITEHADDSHRVFFPQKRLSYHDGTAPPAQELLALAKAGSKRLVGGADAGGAVGVLGATNSGGVALMPEKAVALILERLRRRFLRPEAEPIQLLDVPTSRASCEH